jgi:hypothetical protein
VQPLQIEELHANGRSVEQECLMVYRKGERTPKEVAQDYPHHVAIRVPPRGLGQRLDKLHAWCQSRRLDYATMGLQSGMTDMVCFCFKDDTLAEEFRAALPRIRAPRGSAFDLKR